MTLAIDCADLAATEAFASRVAHALQPPLVIGLIGDLGAGKTAFARALIQTLAPGARVKSPTYTLIESYELAGLQVHHLDLYRLRHPDELVELGLEELLVDDAVMLIEWPDKGGEHTPPLDLELQIGRLDETRRRIELRPRTASGAALFARLRT